MLRLAGANLSDFQVSLAMKNLTASTMLNEQGHVMEQDRRVELLTFSLATRHSTTELILHKNGTRYENRTRLSALKGQRPNR
jgi:hypothetical protein